LFLDFQSCSKSPSFDIKKIFYCNIQVLSSIDWQKQSIHKVLQRFHFDINVRCLLQFKAVIQQVHYVPLVLFSKHI